LNKKKLESLLHGEEKTIKELLQQGAGVDEEYYTSMQLTERDIYIDGKKDKELQKLKDFVQAGGDIHEERDNMLRAAILNAEYVCIDYLLSKGAYVHKEDYMGMKEEDILRYGEGRFA
jgi:hypothetical protein